MISIRSCVSSVGWCLILTNCGHQFVFFTATTQCSHEVLLRINDCTVEQSRDDANKRACNISARGPFNQLSRRDVWNPPKGHQKPDPWSSVQEEDPRHCTSFRMEVEIRDFLRRYYCWGAGGLGEQNTVCTDSSSPQHPHLEMISDVPSLLHCKRGDLPIPGSLSPRFRPMVGGTGPVPTLRPQHRGNASCVPQAPRGN